MAADHPTKPAEPFALNGEPKKPGRPRNAVRQKAYHEANRDKILAQKKVYYEAKREEILINRRARYQVNRKKIRAYQKSYYETNREKMNEMRIRNMYGISLKDVDELKKKQDFRCAICRTSFNLATPHIDHDHSTKKARGLLCSQCNKGLGCFRDNPEMLRQAIKYLKHYA